MTEISQEALEGLNRLRVSLGMEPVPAEPGYVYPACDECGVLMEECVGDEWCGECGNCRTHCAHYVGCGNTQDDLDALIEQQFPTPTRLGRIKAALLWPAVRRYTDARYRVRAAWQKVTKGYSDEEWYGLDYHLAKWLSVRLNALADNSHGFPASPDIDEDMSVEEIDRRYEEWTEAVRVVAIALGRYADKDENFHDLETDRKITEDAKVALHWVADHIEELWD